MILKQLIGCGSVMDEDKERKMEEKKKQKRKTQRSTGKQRSRTQRSGKNRR
jgi:hypothetical protein